MYGFNENWESSFDTIEELTNIYFAYSNIHLVFNDRYRMYITGQISFDDHPYQFIENYKEYAQQLVSLLGKSLLGVKVVEPKILQLLFTDCSLFILDDSDWYECCTVNIDNVSPPSLIA